MARIIKFFETTLRDGEQTPGINYFAEEKLEIARALADMGFDTLDCGFAISGEPEFEAIRLIARNVAAILTILIARGSRSKTPPTARFIPSSARRRCTAR